MDLTDSFVYTVGMTDEEISDHLHVHHTGVLSLAADNRPYAIPVSYAVADDGTVYLRLSDDDTSRKFEFMDVSDGARLVVYEEGKPDGTDSWSVVLTGRLAEVDPATAPAFDPFHVFDEDIDTVSLRYFRIGQTERIGRRSVR